MMTNGPWVAMSALVGLMATSAAQADLITIDADAYAPGTDVSNAFDGATLSHLTFSPTGMQRSSVYAAGCTGEVCDALGTASFGYEGRNDTIRASWYSTAATIGNCFTRIISFCYNNNSLPEHLLEVSFDAATDFIQFDSTYGSDSPYFWALDAAGNILSTVTRQGTILQRWNASHSYSHEVMTVTSSLGNIARIVIAGNGGFSTVDSITWNGPATNVPEPETLAMMLAGLVGVAVTTRRRGQVAPQL
jgi:hypothetical protein